MMDSAAYAGLDQTIHDALAAARPRGAPIAFAPFAPPDLAAIRLRSGQAFLQPFVDDPHYQAAMCHPGLAWTGRIAGVVVGCSGVMPQWPGRAIAWAFYTDDIARPADWGRIRRKTLEILRAAHAAGFHRIDTTIKRDWPEANRWAAALGFVNETPDGMRGYSPDLRDCNLYARFR